MIAALDRLRAMRDGLAPPPRVYRTLSLSVIDAHTGFVKIGLLPSAKHANPFGIVAGGVLLTVIDTAASWACETSDRAGRVAITIDIQAHFLRPVPLQATLFTAAARTVFKGSRTAVAQARLTGPNRTLHLIATLTCLFSDRSSQRFEPKQRPLAGRKRVSRPAPVQVTT